MFAPTSTRVEGRKPCLDRRKRTTSRSIPSSNEPRSRSAAPMTVSRPSTSIGPLSVPARITGRSPADPAPNSEFRGWLRLISGRRSAASSGRKLATTSPSPLKLSSTVCSHRITAPASCSSRRQSPCVAVDPLIDAWWVETITKRRRPALAAGPSDPRKATSAPWQSRWRSSTAGRPSASSRLASEWQGTGTVFPSDSRVKGPGGEGSRPAEASIQVALRPFSARFRSPIARLFASGSTHAARDPGTAPSHQLV